MQLKLYKSFDQELESIWVEFEKTAIGTPFQYYNWLSHWQATVGSKIYFIDPYVITLINNENLTAILPFGIRKSMGISVLEWLGGPNADYMGYIFHPDWKWTNKDIIILWQEVLKQLPAFDIIHFQRQLDIISGYKNPISSQFTGIQKTRSYQTTLDVSWGKYYKTKIKKKLRADSTRQRRRLEKIGDLIFIVANEKVEKELITKTMIRQKQDQYKSTGVWDMFALPGFQEFYNGLVNLDHGDKRVHYSALFVNKTIIATHVGLIDNDTFYYIMPSYKGGDWKKYSSGRLLLENLLEWAIENHLEFFDFTVGDESYKKIWCDMETKLYETLRSFTFKGRIYILIQYFSRYMKKIPWFVKIYRAIKNWLKL